MDFTDLPSDFLFVAGMMAAIMPIFTSVYGLYFSLVGVALMMGAVYSSLKMPFGNMVVIVGGVAGLSLGIYSALQFGELESGIPLFMGIALIASSLFVIEEESRRFI